MNELVEGVLASLAFGAVGLVLLAVGFYMVDLLTPGRLGHLIFVDRNRDASLVLASSLLAIGGIVASAIFTADGDTLENLVETVAYGAIGVAMQGAAFVVLDLLTPGKLGETLTDEDDDPAVWVAVAMNLAVGVIVMASLS
ncbi:MULTISPECIES: DUF350 domain-containing protein [unclassified Nocardioides]|uniref:DUF350 domain-containing protein n=1 Tax=unclassified Nocardioides TaxID=2615069 RepID=UPI00070084BC|nr:MULTISPECIES: DUF350 domain-containing protein [unclassified Nocardioides]KQY56257.1 hypothetical protein ASD30_07830 [Nocardioides sp. Root140]KQZ75041.1 hypothetical protein ASD66_01295 [Nocardioides sp. Root151]KRF10575.1 hypothetical protein ASH02_21030 [Nocardioides sp. Soil796]